MRTFLISFVCLFSATGCVTTGGGDNAQSAVAIQPVAQTQPAMSAARLAQELDWRARMDPASLEAVQDEMRTLALRLAAPVEPPPDPDPVLEDPDGGLSLLHAIHLASYRDLANARSGWLSLQALMPDVLTDRLARIETADLGTRGVFLRLKAGPFDSQAEAAGACQEVENAGGYCAVTDFSGEWLLP